jgi:MoaA/NifB/PqqE/SkfB family radical SAM enzyme
MFKFTELHRVHLEITNNCQASCPMCARNVNGGLPNPLIKTHSWSLEDFKTIMNQTVLDQIEHFYFCGNYGDPILNNDLISMCKYSAEVAPKVSVAIHTNGGARNVEWWSQLARAMPVSHRVVFALDGLSDTHSLYRIGTDFDTIIQHATAFINAGGIAEWVFIRFKHNEHQVEQARELSKQLGFKTFVLKNSSRFIMDPKVDVLDRNGNITHIIEPANDTPIKFIDKKIIDSFKDIIKDVTIDCSSKNDGEIYIDAYKNLYPCCYLASVPFLYRKQTGLSEILKTMLAQHNDMMTSLGETNTIKKSVKDIIESEEYQTVWTDYWSVKKLLICARTCGKGVAIDFSRQRDQFVL